MMMSKRKSNSTIRRDNKRLQEYNENYERQLAENINIDLCTSDVGKSPRLLKCVNDRQVDNVNKDKKKSSDVNIEDNNNNLNKTISTEACKLDSSDKNNDDNGNVSSEENSDLFSKFALKRSMSDDDKLIGNIESTGRLIIFSIHRKKYEKLIYGDRYYRKFNKVWTEDFNDVLSTNFINDQVNQAILMMIEYV
ncbi:Hypothetical predicted protein [Mytilus galloprovincialis]|uniref:Uncharacterized protein n=1 Tax=Mytilus galloprovincialis TaxID=29158 RepID=A0A8B6HP36_MYTGA|nr:Hypothetical predicted protein [Mytilus galloprovincialis]